RRGLHVGVVAQAARGFAEQRRRIGHLHGRVGIGPRAPGLERVAAFLLLALQVAGLARRADQVIETVVVGLQLVVRERPVLAGEVGVEDVRAVALDMVAA